MKPVVVAILQFHNNCVVFFVNLQDCIPLCQYFPVVLVWWLIGELKNSYTLPLLSSITWPQHLHIEASWQGGGNCPVSPNFSLSENFLLVGKLSSKKYTNLGRKSFESFIFAQFRRKIENLSICNLLCRKVAAVCRNITTSCPLLDFFNPRPSFAHLRSCVCHCVCGRHSLQISWPAERRLEHKTFHAVFELVVGFLLPVCVMAVCYSRLLLSLLTSARETTGTTGWAKTVRLHPFQLVYVDIMPYKLQDNSYLYCLTFRSLNMLF